MLLAAVLALPLHAETDDRARVTALADRFVAEYEKSFPLSFSFSGLPVEAKRRPRNQFARGHRPLAGPDEGHVRRARRDQAGRIRQGARSGSPGSSSTSRSGRTSRRPGAAASCGACLRSAGNPRCPRSRRCSRWVRTGAPGGARALARLGPWVDQEIANLGEGIRLGYIASAAATQLDAWAARLDARTAARRIDAHGAGDARWDGRLSPASGSKSSRARYGRRSCAIAISSATLTSQGPHSPSLDGMPGGRECYRAAMFAVTTVDADPEQLFELPSNRSSASTRWRSTSAASCTATRRQTGSRCPT